MEIKVNPHNSEIKHLVHGDIKFDYLPISGFAIFLTFFESTVSTYINLPLNPKTLETVQHERGSQTYTQRNDAPMRNRHSHQR